MNIGLLDEATFRTVVASTPLLSIDLIITRNDGGVLLGRRLNRPAQNSWFVPGGRVRKNETLDNAFTRLTREELSIDLSRQESRLFGIFEHFYEDSAFGADAESLTTHYVVLGYELQVPEICCQAMPAAQHSAYRWFERGSICDNEDVHEYTKAYFR